MKIIVAVTAISLVFLTLACQKTEEVVVPSTKTTNTQTSTNTTTTVKLSSQEIYDTFVRLALKNSAGTQVMTIRKWLPTKAQIKIFWDGGRTTVLTTALDKIIADMNLLNKYNKMIKTEVVGEADIIINRVDVATHNAKYASYQVTNTTVQGNTFTQWSGTNITKAIIWLSPTTASSVQNGVLRHELTHALGIGHTENTKSIMIPVMSSTTYDFNTFSTLDQRILQILSDNRVKHGMNEANISDVIKEYAAK
ncbi:hypothetical protein EMA8858_02013 [Emticicia aquatica]|uniref:Peptidase metallopeptidase domain-containing protein n=1 Tax=Emticicia aquatica TaxID=1681835 RepID=A0ABM9APV2_9BACT|nr:DUF2927 domain-containing protein [Emticicia aquatica]CAH0995885.1 hypothetical protein EMA8858_02013 [Emticicia aquatica]